MLRGGRDQGVDQRREEGRGRRRRYLSFILISPLLFFFFNTILIKSLFIVKSENVIARYHVFRYKAEKKNLCSHGERCTINHLWEKGGINR